MNVHNRHLTSNIWHLAYLSELEHSMSRLATILRNVFHVRLAAYFLIAAGAAAGVIATHHYLPPGFPDYSPVIGFAVIMLITALVFPLCAGSLPKNATDFWYYVLAGAGVVTLFMNTAVERQRVGLADMYQEKLEEYEAFQRLTHDLKATEAEARAYSAQIKDKARTLVMSIYQLDPNDCPALHLYKNQDQNGKVREFSADHGRVEPYIRPDEMITCLMSVHLPTLEALANLKEITDVPGLFESTGRAGLYEIATITGLDKARFAAFFEYATLLKANDLKPGGVEQRLAAYRADLKNLSEEHRQLGGIDANLSALSASRFKQLYWPYFLLIALSLKLARVPYAGRDPVDKD